LFTAWSTNPENRAVYVGSLDSKSKKLLMLAESKVLYSDPGFVIYLRQGTLVAQPFDPNKIEFTGEAFPIAQGVLYAPANGTAAFFASNQGTIIYRKPADDPQTGAPRPLMWIDRSGASQNVGTPVNGGDIRLSPDGKFVAFGSFLAGNADVWL